MAETSAGLSLAFFMTALVAATVASHHSSGSCSLQPGLGQEMECSAMAVARTLPSSSQTRVLVPLVPMSMPRRWAIVAGSIEKAKGKRQRAKESDRMMTLRLIPMQPMNERTEKCEVLTIRTTCAADAEALCALRVEGLGAHPTAFVTTVEEALAEDWVKRAAEGNGEGLSAIFVAEAGGQLVGMTGIVASPREKLRHSAFIWGVYVRPAWRGGRLAERLVDAAVAWAERKGCTIVRLGVTAGNEAAYRTYVRCGFEVYGRERASQVVEGVEYEEVLMDRRVGRGRR